MILFTGGGTGGHVFPGIAVARHLGVRRRVRLLWVGSEQGFDRSIVLRYGIAFVGIPTGKLRRYLSLRNLIDVFRIAAGLVRSVAIVKRVRPALLFSKGGFASVPPVVAAWLCGVPVVTHESDADPGLATRINARFAHRILVPYEATRERFAERLKKRVVVTGNPIRPELLAGRAETGARMAGFRPQDDRPTVLFLGGSLGARQVNELVIQLHPHLADRWRFVHQTGERSDDLRMPDPGPTYFGRPFFTEELPHLLALADVVVCRAGASTLWEVAAMAKPMLLIPLGAGSRGDQERNAAIFEAAGAARVFRDPVRLGSDVATALEQLSVSAELRGEMGRNAHQLIHIDASERIVTILEELIDSRLGI